MQLSFLLTIGIEWASLLQTIFCEPLCLQWAPSWLTDGSCFSYNSNFGLQLRLLCLQWETTSEHLNVSTEASPTDNAVTPLGNLANFYRSSLLPWMFWRVTIWRAQPPRRLSEKLWSFGVRVLYFCKNRLYFRQRFGPEGTSQDLAKMATFYSNWIRKWSVFGGGLVVGK